MSAHCTARRRVLACSIFESSIYFNLRKGNSMNENHMKEILDHILPRIALIAPGELTDCEGLIDPGVWYDVPGPERRYVFGRPISVLVAQGKVLLEFAGFDRKRHNLYRKK
jgi:hypothetical protein